MKTIITVMVIITCHQIKAQIADWYGVDLSRIGYKNSTISFENIPKDEAFNYPLPKGDFGATSVRGGSFELSADLYKKHFYFHIDGSSFLDLGALLFQFNTKERWYNNNKYDVLRTDLLPIRLAWGTNITKYVNLYVGGQWAYTGLGITYKESNSPYQDTRIGGHTYGFGGHLVGAYRFVNLRYSYMYNWLSQAQTFTGNSILNETVASFGGAKVGLFFKMKHVFSTSDAGFLPNDRSEIQKSELEFAQKSWQSSQFAAQFQFSVGIYSAGLFSGISKAGTKAISEIEAGVAKERREKRRRTIKYND